MGTRGTGLWDDEKSVNQLGRFTKIEAKPTLIHYLVSHAVKLWFTEIDGTTFARAVDRKSREAIRLPKPLYNGLVDLARNPKLSMRGSRKPQHTKVLGANRDGYRLEALFAMEEVPAMLAPMSEALAERLDRAFKTKKTFADEPFAELGMLVELTNANVYQTAERVAAWEAGFDKMNERTTEDRPQWDEFVTRVRPAFAMLLKP